MRFDIRDQFSVNQALAGAAAQVSTNSKRKKESSQDLGIGMAHMGAAIFISEDAAGVGTDMTFEIIEATDGALTTGVGVLASVTIPKAKLLNGASFFLPLPGYLMSKEFYGMRYTPVGGAVTTIVNTYWGKETDVANFKSFKTPYEVKN